MCPFDIFRSKDGHFALAAATDKHWPILCSIIGRPDLGAIPRWQPIKGGWPTQYASVAPSPSG